MPSARLSVVIPNHNHATYIGRALQAMLNQSLKALEIIVVDDGSTDNSVAVIERFAEVSPNIKLMRNDCNRGVVFSMNRGLDSASGDYVYFGSADDWVLPGFFEKAMSMATDYPEAGIIFGKMRMVRPGGEELGIGEVASWQERTFATPDMFLKEYLEMVGPTHSLCGATIYKRKPLVEVGGFRPELRFWCDTFAARAVALKYGACYIPDPCTCWRSAPDSFSGLSLRDAKSALRVVASAAWLMQSPELRDRFPTTYVAKWQRDYVNSLAEASVSAVRKRISARTPRIKTALKGPRTFRGGVSALYRWLVKRWEDALFVRERSRLLSYYRTSFREVAASAAREEVCGPDRPGQEKNCHINGVGRSMSRRRGSPTS